MGEVTLYGADGQKVTDTAFVREAGGFTFFGDACLEASARCPYTVSRPYVHVETLDWSLLDTAACAGECLFWSSLSGNHRSVSIHSECFMTSTQNIVEWLLLDIAACVTMSLWGRLLGGHCPQ